MRRVVAACRSAGTAVGAHPSFVDPARFGREALDVPGPVLRAQVREQVAALLAVCRALGVELVHVKPHGALYHRADADPAVAEARAAGVADAAGDLVLVGPPGGCLQAAARSGYLREAFADRGVDAAGRLLPRGTPGALITGPAAAAERARGLAGIDVVCVHGDTPGAVAIARAVRAAIR
jgi:UPF0271 protein